MEHRQDQCKETSMKARSKIIKTIIIWELLQKKWVCELIWNDGTHLTSSPPLIGRFEVEELNVLDVNLGLMCTMNQDGGSWTSVVLQKEKAVGLKSHVMSSGRTSERADVENKDLMMWIIHSVTQQRESKGNSRTMEVAWSITRQGHH